MDKIRMRNFYNNIKNGNIIFLLNGNAIIFILLLFFTAEIQPKSGNLLIKAMTSDSLTNKLVQINAAEYVWNIDNTDSWNDLHTFLPSAKMAGIAVWIKLLPPSKVPQYSEPFKTDYIRWSEEIAKLSLRYSNLKGYSIQELQLNIDQGYFTQSYIDNVKAKGISINPKLQFIITDKTYNLYYVDKDATGSGTGSDWKNAATSIASLNWDSIKGGDTIYISGGNSSKSYTSALIPKSSGSINSKIIITKGKDINHNGEVIFDVTGNYSALNISSIDYLEISHLTFRNASTNNTRVLSIESSDGIDIKYCNVLHPSSPGIIYRNSYGGKILYSTVKTGNVNTTGETDGINLYNSGYIEIAYNTFIDANSNSTPHKDIIQGLYSFGNGGINKIHHNFMMQNTTANSQACILLEDIQGTWHIYNNIIVNRATDFSHLIELRNISNSNLPIYAKIFNNTIVGQQNNYPIQVHNSDSLEIVNNVIYKPDGYKGIDLQGSYNYLFIDDNQYYFNTTNNHARINSTWYSFSQWKALGNDANSESGQFGFKNLNGTLINDYLLDNNGIGGIDEGTALKLFNEDINGTPRPRGLYWDRGALEQ